MNARKYILELARSFPCLRHKVKGLTEDEWDVDKFIGQSHVWSTGERLCALFVANVWNPGYAAGSGWTFDLFDFIGTADGGNKRALMAWLANPVWP